MSSKIVPISIDLFISIRYLCIMPKRKMYNTTLDIELLKKLKVLAAQNEKRQNDLLEEAIKDLLKKYKNPPEKS